MCVCVELSFDIVPYYVGVLRFPSRRDTRRAHEQPRTVVPWLYPTYGDGAADTLWVRQNPFLEKSRTTFLACLAGFFLKKKSPSATFRWKSAKLIECNVFYETFISRLHSFVAFSMCADVKSTWMISMTSCIVCQALVCNVVASHAVARLYKQDRSRVRTPYNSRDVSLCDQYHVICLLSLTIGLLLLKVLGF